MLLVTTAALIEGSSHAHALDAFNTGARVASSAAAPLLADTSCQPFDASHPVDLAAVVLAAICTHPRVRQAWAEARAQAASVGISEAAYLPTLNATAGIERDTLSTDYDYSALGVGTVGRAQNSSSRYSMLNLSWVLLDFGKRDAARRQANALLSAANAAQDASLQTVFFDAAQAFYALRDARASVDAALLVEQVAQDSLAQAGAKHAGGAGTLADELQARTSFRRAVLDRVDAEGRLRIAQGALAVAMGLDAETTVQISDEDGETLLPEDIDDGIDTLIEQAKQRQPKLLAARARLQAARAAIDMARAQDRPTIALVGSMVRNNPSYQQQPQSIPVTGSHGSTIGIQVTIPLFEGFASSYRVAQAQASADGEEAAARDVELQVSLDVWSAYHGVRTDAANLANSRDLLDDARHALDVARGRYKEGVGTFTDLLNAQTALADAQRERVQAVSQWRTARLRLAASLGKLGLWNR
ncbi:TolC family protein [Burkholderia sp. Ap-962]|uniref:TolC family protein n=1 Tax=Burkholderia sp. Ap-962 TaxID=2608333 RepID=UPI001F044BF3|nr:TolC family protein [Burkholderia sp. Ap-962]